jgi:hypothetical protein
LDNAPIGRIERCTARGMVTTPRSAAVSLGAWA